MRECTMAGRLVQTIPCDIGKAGSYNRQPCEAYKVLYLRRRLGWI